MEPLINPKSQPSNLTGLMQGLSANLATLQPEQTQTTKLITYALLATAVVGIMVYHYIKENERTEDLKNYHG